MTLWHKKIKIFFGPPLPLPLGRDITAGCLFFFDDRKQGKKTQRFINPLNTQFKTLCESCGSAVDPYFHLLAALTNCFELHRKNQFAIFRFVAMQTTTGFPSDRRTDDVVCPSPPPLAKLWFTSKQNETALWHKCLQNLNDWKRCSSAAGKSDGAMVARFVLSSNLLEDTLVEKLDKDSTLATLAETYNNDTVYVPSRTGQTSGLSQLVQHLRAFQLLIPNCLQSWLTEDLVKEVHKTMMEGLCDDDGEPVPNGRYRECSVRAGEHVFPFHQTIHAAMPRILDEYNSRVSSTDHDPYELAGWLFSEVVSLHPFKDGNGRLSRLLWCYSLMKDGHPFPAVLTSGHRKSQRHLVKCLQRDRDLFYGKHPYVTSLTVVSVSLGWTEFLCRVS